MPGQPCPPKYVSRPCRPKVSGTAMLCPPAPPHTILQLSALRQRQKDVESELSVKAGALQKAEHEREAYRATAKQSQETIKALKADDAKRVVQVLHVCCMPCGATKLPLDAGHMPCARFCAHARSLCATFVPFQGLGRCSETRPVSRAVRAEHGAPPGDPHARNPVYAVWGSPY